MDFEAQVAKSGGVILAPRLAKPLAAAGGAVLIGLAVAVTAQIDRSVERGVPPIDSSANFEVTGVLVDVSGANADAARTGGWRLAQRRGWAQLWARANDRPVAQAPALPDSTLDTIVAGIEVEEERISPRRYVARLGVLFDRARAGQLLGAKGGMRRSPPMLVIPLTVSGGTAQAFEARTDWQRAWARFRSGGSPIDYVRPVGNGIDPLILNAGQAGRPGRGWWRMLLDRYGAADVVVPTVRLTRLWPGGPVIGRFAALHGVDQRRIAAFTLTAADADALPRMLDDAVRRIDAAYAAALRSGDLSADPSLVIEEEVADDLLESVAADPAPPPAAGPQSILLLQVDTPTDQALMQTEAALRGLAGVVGANTTSVALGGVSLIRVTWSGDPTTFRAALAARGIAVRGVLVEQMPPPAAVTPQSPQPTP
ncbi:MAG: heavy-metal-associated domain-containing protein [Sphingomonas fennica]